MLSWRLHLPVRHGGRPRSPRRGDVGGGQQREAQEPRCNIDVLPKNRGVEPIRVWSPTHGFWLSQENYYRPPDQDACLPCDCFPHGSHSRACDMDTGQCVCKSGVIGRQCNRCDNPFAEVTMLGCEGPSCPLSPAGHVAGTGCWACVCVRPRVHRRLPGLGAGRQPPGLPVSTGASSDLALSEGMGQSQGPALPRSHAVEGKCRGPVLDTGAACGALCTLAATAMATPG